MKITIPIMFCYDKNYVIPAAVAFYSLMNNANKEYNYILYTLHSDITDEQQKKLIETVKMFHNCSLEFVNMNQRLDDFWKKNYKGDHFSKEVMYKLLAASIFPQYEKIIISDVDVVFLGDISSSYFSLDGNNKDYIAGVKPIGKVQEYLKNYSPEWSEDEIVQLGEICGGYIVMNLKKIREDNFEKVFIDSLEKNGYRLNQMEQDIFNITCHNRISHLSLNYVACSYLWDYFQKEDDFNNDINYSNLQIKSAMDNPIQLHYATSIKPWKNVDCTKSDIWYKYLAQTPFLAEFLHQLPDKIVVSEKNIIYKQLIDIKKNAKTGITYKIIRYVKNNPTFFLKKSFYIKLFNKTNYKLKKFQKIVCIFDDSFPSKNSPFRFEEYNYYCHKFKNVLCITNGYALKALNDDNLEKLIYNYKLKNKKVNFFNSDKNPLGVFENFNMIQNFINGYGSKIAIVTFLNNLLSPIDNLSYIEKLNIPFILNLYPGGGFILNDRECDEKLVRIFSSNCFEKVIVTQKIVFDYLIEKKFCDSKKIVLIAGVVTPQKLLNQKLNNKVFWGSKKTFDICFVAHKYCKNGADKGYDVFVEVAKKLCLKYKNIHFHIVGEFNENDINVSQIKNNIHFYGVQKTEWFKEFYKDKDIILCPNKSGVLVKGHFDGFPTACATEAALNKTLIMSTDDLNQNILFHNDKDIILINHNVNDIIRKIEKLYNNPEKLKQLAINGYNTVNHNYSKKIQVVSRKNIVKNILKYNRRFYE